MKNLQFFMLLLLPIWSYGQDTAITLCHTPATESFAVFAANENFNAAHDTPLPYVHRSEVGKMLTFKGSDGKEAKAYVLMAKEDTDNYLFVIHEWWGLNEHIKKEAEKLYHDMGNVNVMALDLYDGKVADKREEAAKYMQSVKTERATAIIEGALNHIGDKARVGTIGWCFGGGWSLQSALIAGEQAVACVIYYGMPEKDVERLKTLSCDVLGIFASKEKWITPEVVGNFAKDMKKAEKDLVVKSYDAEHAFANPSNPQYDKEATKDAYGHTMEFLKKRLK